MICQQCSHEYSRSKGRFCPQCQQLLERALPSGRATDSRSADNTNMKALIAPGGPDGDLSDHRNLERYFITLFKEKERLERHHPLWDWGLRDLETYRAHRYARLTYEKLARVEKKALFKRRSQLSDAERSRLQGLINDFLRDAQANRRQRTLLDLLVSAAEGLDQSIFDFIPDDVRAELLKSIHDRDKETIYKNGKQKKSATKAKTQDAKNANMEEL